MAQAQKASTTPAKKNRFSILQPRNGGNEPEKPWLLQFFTEKEETAFIASAVQFGGSLDATAAYFLNCWMRTPAGTRWLLDESIGVHNGFDTDPDLSELSKILLANTKSSVLKRAEKDFAGDVKAAIIESVREQMVVFGLPIFY